MLMLRSLNSQLLNVDHPTTFNFKLTVTAGKDEKMHIVRVKVLDVENHDNTGNSDKNETRIDDTSVLQANLLNPDYTGTPSQTVTVTGIC